MAALLITNAWALTCKVAQKHKVVYFNESDNASNECIA